MEKGTRVKIRKHKLCTGQTGEITRVCRIGYEVTLDIGILIIVKEYQVEKISGGK